MAAGLKTIIALSFVRKFCHSYPELMLTEALGSCRWLPPRHPLCRTLPQLLDPRRRRNLRACAPTELDMRKMCEPRRLHGECRQRSD